MKPYYNHAGITIYHGDCRDILPGLDPVDLVLTDPPYGVTKNKWDDSTAALCLVDFPLSVFTCGERLLAQLIAAKPDRFLYIWVWDRVNKYTDFLNAKTRPMRQHELIAVFGESKNIKFKPIKKKGEYKDRSTTGGREKNNNYGKYNRGASYGRMIYGKHPSTIISFPNNDCLMDGHPTRKPVELFRYLAQSYQSEIICDPFMGSGTTLRAAKDLGRKAIGIEIEERYCQIAADRLSQEVLKL